MTMRIIGHRGCASEAPENTAASIRLAWEQDADGVEFDVLMTRDGHAVVHHDLSLLRTTGRDARVADVTLAETAALDAGSWKGAAWRGEPVPRLFDILRLTPRGRIVFVEVKCGAEILPALRRDVDASGLDREQVSFVGFDPEAMGAVKRAFPSHSVLLNVEMKLSGRKSPTADEIISRVRSHGLDGAGPGYCEAVNASLIRALRAAGLKLFIWTVDDAGPAAMLRDEGVDYLVTNRPGGLRRDLSQTARPGRF